MIKRTLTLTILSLSISLSLNFSAKAQEPQSQVFILFDLSSSYFETGSKDVAKSFRKIASVVLSKERGPIRPSLIHVLPIGDISQTQDAICEAEMPASSRFRRSVECSSGLICLPDDAIAKQWFSDCANKITKMSVQGTTDISGALSLASQLTLRENSVEPFMFVLSDMFEYRNKEVPVSKIRLDDFEIVILCGSQLNSEGTEPQYCLDTVDTKWRKQLKALGANNVSGHNEKKSWASEIEMQ